MASALGVGSQHLRRTKSVAYARRPHGLVSESMVMEIASRLIGDGGVRPAESRGIAPGDVETFVARALDGETADLVAQVDSHLSDGVPLETVFIELLAPAARRIGEYWDDDTAEFVDVTMALWRLQELLHEVAWRTPNFARYASGDRFALFAPFPGDQHSFGTAMIAECFARAGWGTELLTGAGRAELLGAVAANHFDLIALTVSCDCNIDALSSLVRAVRSVSHNPQALVMLGGRAIADNPGLAEAAGADATAGTAIEALQMAGELLDSRSAVAVR